MHHSSAGGAAGLSGAGFGGASGRLLRGMDLKCIMEASRTLWGDGDAGPDETETPSGGGDGTWKGGPP